MSEPDVQDLTVSGPPAKEPLYPRLLQLRYVRPGALQRALLVEGVAVVAAILVLADLASAWALLVLPLATAAMVKLNDLVELALHRDPDEIRPLLEILDPDRTRTRPLQPTRGGRGSTRRPLPRAAVAEEEWEPVEEDRPRPIQPVRRPRKAVPLVEAPADEQLVEDVEDVEIEDAEVVDAPAAETGTLRRSRKAAKPAPEPVETDQESGDGPAAVEAPAPARTRSRFADLAVRFGIAAPPETAPVEDAPNDVPNDMAPAGDASAEAPEPEPVAAVEEAPAPKGSRFGKKAKPAVVEPVEDASAEASELTSELPAVVVDSEPEPVAVASVEEIPAPKTSRFGRKAKAQPEPQPEPEPTADASAEASELTSELPAVAAGPEPAPDAPELPEEEHWEPLPVPPAVKAPKASRFGRKPKPAPAPAEKPAATPAETHAAPPAPAPAPEEPSAAEVTSELPRVPREPALDETGPLFIADAVKAYQAQHAPPAEPAKAKGKRRLKR